jgi:hypothetical protein
VAVNAFFPQEAVCRARGRAQLPAVQAHRCPGSRCVASVKTPGSLDTLSSGDLDSVVVQEYQLCLVYSVPGFFQ